MRDSDRSALWILAELSLAAAVLLLPSALGGAPEWTLPLLFACALASTTAWVAGAARSGRRAAWHPLCALLFVPPLLCALQLLPLPPPLLRLVAPASAELRDFALVPLGLDGWRPVSVDPPSTARALVRALSIAGLFFVALQLGRLPAVRRRVLAVVGAAAMLFVGVALAHEIAGLDALFGVWRPQTATPLATPFGNANHLAAFLALGGTVCVGLAVGAPSRESLVGWGVGALGCGLTVFLTMSRGGIASLVATWAFLGALLLARRGGGWRAVAPWLLMAATTVVAVLVAFEQLLARAETLSSIAKLQATKIDAWPMFARALTVVWPAGLGRGAFEVGFSRWQTEQLSVTFTHPENLVLQWAIELGLPAALLLFAAGAWALFRTWPSLAGQRLEQAAFVGVVGAAVHDLFDFSLELNAVPAVAAVVLGLVAGVDAEQPRRVVRRSALAALALLALAGGGALASGLPSHLGAEAALASVVAAAPTAADVRAAAVPLVARHPADHVLYANVARASARRGDPRDALAWTNRWLFLRPGEARAHLTAAEALLRLGRREQALFELKTSFALGDTSGLALGLAVASVKGDYERLLIERPGLLGEAVAVARAKGLGDAVVRDLLQRARAEPLNPAVAQEALERLVELEAERGDPARALTMLDELPAEARAGAPMVLLEAGLLARVGRPRDGAELLQRLLAREPGNLAAAQTAARTLAGSGATGAARAVLSRIRPFVTETAGRLALFSHEAELWEQDERWSRALESWQTASRLAPERADLHYRMARAAERMGALRTAVDSLQRGRRLDSPEGARAQDPWMDQLKARLSERELQALERGGEAPL